MPITRVKGQCFLCERVSTLEAITDSTGDTVYSCRHCGGMNRAARIEAGLDHQLRPLPEWEK